MEPLTLLMIFAVLLADIFTWNTKYLSIEYYEASWIVYAIFMKI